MFQIQTQKQIRRDHSGSSMMITLFRQATLMKQVLAQNGIGVGSLTYMKLFNSLGGSSQAAKIQGLRVAQDGVQQMYLVATGSISNDATLETQRFQTLMMPVGTDDGPVSGTYSIELQDRNGLVLFTRFFDFIEQ